MEGTSVRGPAGQSGRLGLRRAWFRASGRRPLARSRRSWQ